MNIFKKIFLKDNSNKAILLIHGFAGGSYDYGDLPNDLALINNYKVFTYTLPGHDKTVINGVTREDWLKKSEEEIEKIINNGYDEIYVIGHSMGGVIAAYLASKYKEVKKLVLAAPAFQYLKFKNDKLDVVESIKAVPSLFKDYNTEEVISRLFRVPSHTIREFMKLTNEHYEDIKNITCPTLLLHGTKDTVVPSTSTKYVFDNINSKSVNLIELKNLTHDLFINDRYKEVKKIIIKFLKNNNSNKKKTHKI